MEHLDSRTNYGRAATDNVSDLPDGLGLFQYIAISLVCVISFWRFEWVLGKPKMETWMTSCKNAKNVEEFYSCFLQLDIIRCLGWLLTSVYFDTPTKHEIIRGAHGIMNVILKFAWGIRNEKIPSYVVDISLIREDKKDDRDQERD